MLHVVSRQRKALALTRALSSGERPTLIVHYACESFDDLPEGATPATSCISVFDWKTGLTTSFFPAKSAQAESVNLCPGHVDIERFERESLVEFYQFLQRWLDKNSEGERFIVHWNMKGRLYGFSALLERARARLKTDEKLLAFAEDFPPANLSLVNLAETLQDIYGSDYCHHPRLPNLIHVNGLGHKGFLAGEAEAMAFDLGRYNRLCESVERKVRLMKHIIDRASENRLAVNRRELLSVRTLGWGADWIENHPLMFALGLASATFTVVATVFGQLTSFFGWAEKK